MSKIIKFSVLASAIAVLAAQANAQTPEYTLRFSHMYPAVAAHNKEVYTAWADAVKKESNGRIEVEIYPSSTLAKPAAQYDAVKNRIADIAMAVQGYTANRFPLTQIVELPGIAKNAKHGSCVLQSLYDEKFLDEEYADTKPLFFYTHGAGGIHTVDKAIKKPSDFNGLRIRRPTSVVAKLLVGLGAQPVGMPAPSAYQSTQRGVIDGVVFPWEGNYTFRLNELTKYHTEVGGLYTLSFLVTMNKSVYNSMPADLKAVIDNNSGAKWSQNSAKVYDRLDALGRQQAIDMGDEIYTVEGGANNPDWKPVLDAATEDYLSELEAKKLPARKVYQRAVELAKSCDV